MLVLSYRFSPGFPRVRAGAPGGARSLAVSIALAACFVAGCIDDETRVASHLESARELIAEGKPEEALLELHSALHLAPESVEANNALAEIELRNGRYDLAIGHIETAYRLDPEDTRSALNRARIFVLKVERLDEAKALVDRVIYREPDNVEAYIVRSNLELARGQIRRAIEAAEHAERLAPEDPFVAWQRGRALQGWIHEAQLGIERATDEVFEGAVSAFEDYIDRGGESPWNARLEVARIVSVWPGHTSEAGAIYRAAIDEMPDTLDAEIREQAIRRASMFARLSEDAALLDWSLTKLLELRPDDIQSWIALSNCQRRTGKSQEAVLDRMLETLPTDPEAHAAYARFLISRWKLDEALAYLSEKANEPGQDAPALLSAIANTQFAAKRTADANKTLRRLEREYPLHPRTVLQLAQEDLRAGSPSKAARKLRALAEHAPSPEVHRLLAHAEEALGNLEPALAAIGKAIQASATPELDDEMMRLRWLVRLERWQNVITLLDRVHEQSKRTPEQTLMLALARYGTGREMHGRVLLERLLDLEEPPRAAVLEYARREGLHEQRSDRAYAALEALLERSPNDGRALAEICRLDVERGDSERAIARLDAAIEGSDKPRPTSQMMRAQLYATAGRTDAAIDDARAVVQQGARLPGSAEFLATLLIARGDEQGALKTLQTASKEGYLGPAGHIQLGKIYRDMGIDLAAVANFEKALAAGVDEAMLRNDIAFLLAKNRHNLSRALTMAESAREGLADHPNAVDTLGYVYLQSGSPGKALTLFEDAVARAETPQAGFYYHLGLALESLDRSEEATRAFERALSISPTFPEAADARRALEEARSAIATS